MLLDTTVGWGIDEATARERLNGLLAVASDMVPRLKERGAESDANRRLPDATIAEMVEAGFLRVGQPPRFGGLGLSLDAVCELTMEVGRGCGATAWLTSFYPGHNVCIGLFSEQAQQEYWAKSPDVFSSTASAISFLSSERLSRSLCVRGAPSSVAPVSSRARAPVTRSRACSTASALRSSSPASRLVLGRRCSLSRSSRCS